eukprot:TRINITY_DN4019_c0_g1_i4.p1 TRINITY_DN4019_c0_g1~~TRINITY_DN4019_c0_g1_i4.p1  ORF type:complete len:249 (+),score=53.93 TRINITY_DN4019_c0_g1_i4:36-749(+)
MSLKRLTTLPAHMQLIQANNRKFIEEKERIDLMWISKWPKSCFSEAQSSHQHVVPSSMPFERLTTLPAHKTLIQANNRKFIEEKERIDQIWISKWPKSAQSSHQHVVPSSMPFERLTTLPAHKTLIKANNRKFIEEKKRVDQMWISKWQTRETKPSKKAVVAKKAASAGSSAARLTLLPVHKRVAQEKNQSRFSPRKGAVVWSLSNNVAKRSQIVADVLLERKEKAEDASYAAAPCS